MGGKQSSDGGRASLAYGVSITDGESPISLQSETDCSLCRLGDDNRHAQQPQRSFFDQERGYCQAGRSTQWIQPCCRTAQVRVDLSVLCCSDTLSHLKTYIACMIYAFNATRLMPLYQISDQRNQNITRTHATSLTLTITRKPLNCTS
jgi:hypothetical protein